MEKTNSSRCPGKHATHLAPLAVGTGQQLPIGCAAFEEEEEATSRTVYCHTHSFVCLRPAAALLHS